MNMMKTVLITSAILASTSVLAQTSTTAPAHSHPAPYGDNPNIFKVLGHKAQQKVQNTAEKVDTAAQKGVAKVKPKVENAWEDTKDFATEKSAIAKEKSQHAAATVNQKITETKDHIIGSPNDQPAPIISHPLSESSTSN